MGIKILDFDSKLFRHKIARLDLMRNDENIDKLKDIINYAQNQGVSLLYVHTKDPINLNSVHVKSSFYEEKIIYRKDLNLFNKDIIDPNIGLYTNDFVSETLKEIAIEAAEFSRFKLDINFHKDDYRKLYEIWITKSVNKELATNILIYYNLGIERAFIAYKEHDNICDLTLIAVHHEYRGKRIAHALMRSLEYIVSSGIEYIDVCTQITNKAACNLYSGLNYKIHHTEKIYHLWL
jgi:GNAT superfamily N-acetyltransferase